mgnify:CR=1 FL=1
MAIHSCLLSVVVIGRNEGGRLVKCLDSVSHINIPKDRWELIYVDSGSTDGSPLFAEAFQAHILQIPAEKASAAVARNAGWKFAKGEFILFLDGDTLLDPNFVLEALPYFSDSKIAIVCGQRRELYPEHSVFNRVLDLDWIGPTGEVLSCGGDALIRQEVLQKVNGYDPSLIAGEEPDMCRRMREIGYKIIRIDKVMTRHDLNIERFSQYWRRCYRTGYAYAQVSDKFKETSDPLWLRESRHNLWKNGILVLALILCCLYPWLIPFFILLTLVIILRTAWQVRNKTGSLSTRLLYAIHSQFQHIPMASGQLGYWLNRLRRRVRGVIDYK